MQGGAIPQLINQAANIIFYSSDGSFYIISGLHS